MKYSTAKAILAAWESGEPALINAITQMARGHSRNRLIARAIDRVNGYGRWREVQTYR